MARILVIEDSAAIRQAMAVCLPGVGHSVVMASDGEMGLELADAQSVDLVLLDVEMPRVNGLVVCETLKRDPARRHIPVLMMTGRPTPEILAHARQAGALMILEKPFTLDELLDALSRHLPAGV
jgi:CheY-like chemotaxis protein